MIVVCDIGDSGKCRIRGERCECVKEGKEFV